MKPTMELTQMETAQTQIQLDTPPNPLAASALARIFTRTSTLSAGRRKTFWRSMISESSIWGSSIWGSVVCRARSKRKTLSVRETAALGDRRFVSVIQFERQRFLIGSSPSAITLLAQLPDISSSSEETGEKL
jgi:hypothetical protein